MERAARAKDVPAAWSLLQGSAEVEGKNPIHAVEQEGTACTRSPEVGI
jgi:hypothetical protein